MNYVYLFCISLYVLYKWIKAVVLFPVIFEWNFSPDILINSYANGETRVSKACNALVFSLK